MTVSTLQRTVLELAYFKSMTQPEIARQLGMPLPMVHATAAGGLARLGRAIEKACGAAPPSL
jgi:DNA-directed RNA polymerase specialized sigma24 family protein